MNNLKIPKLKEELIDNYLQSYPREAASNLDLASTDEILTYLANQPEFTSKDILLSLENDVKINILETMDDHLFSKLFPLIDSYVGAMLISRLNKELVDEKLALLPDKLSREIKDLMTFPPDTAGFFMDTRFISFNPSNTVKEVLKKIRTISNRRIVNIYVTNEDGMLLGLIPLHRIAISSPKETLGNIMDLPISANVMAPREEVVNSLQDRNIINLPVVDIDNKLLGIIRYDALIKAAQQDATEDAQTMFGAGREEKALSKVSFAIRKRLPWLEINLLTAFLAASVVGLFEETIAQITVLAVFLPVVAGQSGNTGSQALAVTIRGLALREIRISQWLKVARKEMSVGFFNGVVVALTTSIVVYFWASSFGLAIVIGSSMVFSMVIAGFSGAVIPIFLKSIGQDPAQSSSIVLTTVTDIVGFMSFLGLATILRASLGIT